MKSNKMMMTVLTIGLFLVGTNQAMAQSRIFTLYIQNIDSRPVTFTLKAGSCYEGDARDGQIFEGLEPGDRATVVLARVQGHGCDGEQGRFELTFNPGIGVKKTTAFDFDNSGGLQTTPGGFTNIRVG